MRRTLGLTIVSAVLVGAKPLPPPVPSPPTVTPALATMPGRLEVLTYNVKGLPWPVASGRPQALAVIADRLERMRAVGTAPQVVVVQEAFTAEAKAIGEQAGYRYRATGPGGLAPLDSGLAIFSDYPILDTRRMVFPAGLCAGYDCLAAKGAMTARIAVPGVEQPVEIVTTHLNSAKSSRAPVELRDRIHAGQLAAIDAFVDADHRPRAARIYAGDFNVGNSEVRLAALLGRIRHWRAESATAMGRPRWSPLCDKDDAICRGPLKIAANVPLVNANDWQFYESSRDAELTPEMRKAVFGRDRNGKTLSDHIGFSVVYQFE